MANQKQKNARLRWRKEQKQTGVRPARKSGRHGYTKKEWRDADKRETAKAVVEQIEQNVAAVKE